MKILRDLDQGELEHGDRPHGVFPHGKKSKSFPFRGHPWIPASVPLQACSPDSLGKCANARQDIKDCLAFPTGPVNHSSEDHSCHTVKKQAPAGQGTALSRKCIYTAQRSFFTFRQELPSPECPGEVLSPERALSCCSHQVPPWSSEQTDSLAVQRCRLPRWAISMADRRLLGLEVKFLFSLWLQQIWATLTWHLCKSMCKSNCVSSAPNPPKMAHFLHSKSRSPSCWASRP